MTADEIIDAVAKDYLANTAKWATHTTPEGTRTLELFDDVVARHDYLIIDPSERTSGMPRTQRSNILNAFCALRLLNGAEFLDLHPDVINLLAASGNEAAILMQESHRVFNLPNERTS